MYQVKTNAPAGVLGIGVVILIAIMPLFSFAAKPASNPGMSGAKPAPCPSSPNCVSSDAPESSHQIAPIRLVMPPAEAWEAARKAVAGLPRSRIVKETADYLHAECRSAVFGFVDDLELHLRPAEGIIAVRSASRIGYTDFGVNRRRVEALRAALENDGEGR